MIKEKFHKIRLRNEREYDANKNKQKTKKRKIYREELNKKNLFDMRKVEFMILYEMKRYENELNQIQLLLLLLLVRRTIGQYL